MDELIGLLAEAAALSRRGRAVPQQAPPQKKAAKKGDGKLPSPEAPGTPVSRPVKALDQDRHPVGLTAAFHDRSSLLTMVVAVEVLGPPPSLRPREHV